MTWTAYWRGIVRVARTGIDVYIASIISQIILGWGQLNYWYIVPLGAIITGIFKAIRTAHPDSWFWKYLPL